MGNFIYWLLTLSHEMWNVRIIAVIIGIISVKREGGRETRIDGEMKRETDG